jgi:hypothetical protein
MHCSGAINKITRYTESGVPFKVGYCLFWSKGRIIGDAFEDPACGTGLFGPIKDKRREIRVRVECWIRQGMLCFGRDASRSYQ